MNMTADGTRTHPSQATTRARYSAEWSRAVASVDDRMFTLTYRVAQELGYSRRASERLCRRILLNVPAWRDRRPGLETAGDQAAAPAGRRTRTRLLATVRAAVGPHVDPVQLEQALDTAVLADEVTLLPPRQQATVRWIVEERCTVRQIAERTGWTPLQVARLLRAGLATLTVCGHRQ